MTKCPKNFNFVNKYIWKVRLFLDKLNKYLRVLYAFKMGIHLHRSPSLFFNNIGKNQIFAHLLVGLHIHVKMTRGSSKFSERNIFLFIKYFRKPLHKK